MCVCVCVVVCMREVVRNGITFINTLIDIHKHTLTHTHTNTLTHIHTPSLSHTHTCMHALTHTHTCMHTLSLSLSHTHTHTPEHVHHALECEPLRNILSCAQLAAELGSRQFHGFVACVCVCVSVCVSAVGSRYDAIEMHTHTTSQIHHTALQLHQYITSLYCRHTHTLIHSLTHSLTQTHTTYPFPQPRPL
jgi:hypothetical protein